MRIIKTADSPVIPCLYSLVWILELSCLTAGMTGPVGLPAAVHCGCCLLVLAALFFFSGTARILLRWGGVVYGFLYLPVIAFCCGLQMHFASFIMLGIVFSLEEDRMLRRICVFALGGVFAALAVRDFITGGLLFLPFVYYCCAFVLILVMVFSAAGGSRARMAAMEKEISILRSINFDLESESSRDELTGLLNRKFFWKTLSHLIALYENGGSPFCLVSMDIDLFKKVNDSYGHDAGDIALSSLGRLLTDTCRNSEYPCRLGGDEFCILVQGDVNRAAALAEDIRAGMENLGSEKTGPLSVSVGVVQYRSGLTDRELYQTADAMLYQAKQHRNKVCVEWT